MFVVGYADGGTTRLAIGYAVADPECIFNTGGVVATISFKVAEGATLADSDFGLVLGFLQIRGIDKEYRNTDPDIEEHVIFPKSPTEVEMGTCSHPDIVEVGGKDPTCTEPGYSAGQKCVFCGESIGDTEIIPALGHDYKYDHTINEPTCTSIGKDLYKCTRCGAEEEREVPMKDHVKSSDYKHDDESHWFYCVNCDTVIGEKEAHDPDTEWHCEDTTVDGHYHICSVCKAAVGVEEHVDEDADGECDICGAALHEHIADTSEWIAIIRTEGNAPSRKEVTSHEETAGKGENHGSLRAAIPRR